MKFRLIFIFSLFLFFIPFLKKIHACTSVTVTPQITDTGNEEYVLVARGCRQTNNQGSELNYGFYIDLPPQEGNSQNIDDPFNLMFFQIFKPDSNGQIEYVFSNLFTWEQLSRVFNCNPSRPRDCVIYGKELTLSLSLKAFDSHLNAEDIATVNFQVRDFRDPGCGEIVPDRGNISMACPPECPIANPWEYNNPTAYSICAYPYQTPQPSCSMTVTATVSNNQFNSTAIITSLTNLEYHPGEYRICFQGGSLGIVATNRNCKFINSRELINNLAEGQFVASDIPGGQYGNSITAYFEYNCIWGVGSCQRVCSGSGIWSRLTPTTILGTIFPTVNPTHLTPRPTIPITPGISTPTLNPIDRVNPLFYIKDCNNQTISGQTFGPNTGIITAIGCIGGNIGNIFGSLLRLAIGIAGGIAFLLIIIGGLRIILSSGIPEAMNEGKEIVTSAIVGLLVIIFSVFILRFIGVDLLKIPGFS